MQEQLLTTTNNLRDIVDWLSIGHIVCIHAFGNSIFYCQKDSLNENINNTINEDSQKLIYIDVAKNPGLLDMDEWPYYIEQEGFIRHMDKNTLPTKSENIYSFKI
jgi:hypothetical protein